MKPERIPYLRPVFRGARFEGHAVPVEVLTELVTYRELVVQLARHLFLAANSGRERVPRGFFESFQMVLTGIGEGSAVPEVDRVQVPTQRMGTSALQRDFFDEARDLVEDVMTRAVRRDSLPTTFPLTLLPRFQQLGRSLRADEAIEFRSPGRASGPRFDHTIRRRLMLHEKTSIEDDFDESGELVGGHKDRGVLFVRFDDGHEIEVPRRPDDVQKLLAASGKRVHVVGFGSFNRDERLDRVIDVKEFEIIGTDQVDSEMVGAQNGSDVTYPSPIDEQIDSLLALEPGWYDPESPALDPEGLERLRRFLHALLEGVALPRPYLYPTPEAGARAEWSFSGWDVSATFDMSSGWAELHAAQLDGEGLIEERILISEPQAVETLRKVVGRFASPRGA